MYLQNVAHQLTAPLNAIKWSIEALKDEQVPIHREGKSTSFGLLPSNDPRASHQEFRTDVELGGRRAAWTA